MSKKEQSKQYRDFLKGRITDYSLNTSLIPENSISNSFNVNFDEILGAGKVRKGTTLLGSVVVSGKTPLGMTEFVGPSGTPNLLLSVFKGVSNSTIYYYDTSWHASTINTLSNVDKCRFATLGGRSFIVNGYTMLSSTDGNVWSNTNCITTDSVFPSLIYRYKQRLLAGGNYTNRDRVYFSSVINPNSSPFITWNTTATTGDYIDVNPDDGDNLTGFSDVANLLLVFKSKSFYRMDIINKTVDSETVYDEGAVSQEAITKCQGMVYFYSGTAIYSTNGGYPTQISRLGVQDLIDLVPQANWKDVALGSDTFNVYVSLGLVTLNGLQNYYVLKFSIRDQSWSVHYYPTHHYFYLKFTDSNGRLVRFADDSGYVQTLNLGKTDNSTPIFYSLETQEIDFSNRDATKKITDKIVIYGRNMIYKLINSQLLKTVNIVENLNIEGKYFKFKWSGNTSGASPVFEGFHIPELVDQGVI
jgi:hypothetical protein